MFKRFLPTALLAALACAMPSVMPCVASAATRAVAKTPKIHGTFEITGAGFGHGIGMSQYGAMGFALHGWNHQAILSHYYQGTSLVGVKDSTVTVLLNDGAASFTGASAANGHTLSPSKRYGVLAAGSKLELISGGRRDGTFSAPLNVSGSALDVIGKGRYSGSLTFYPDGAGAVLTVNDVDLENYVRGVIAEEMPASWPQQALEAQAIAARSYVLADVPVSTEYDVYSDTRSQMYGGISAETPATNLAEGATRGQVVESAGRVIPTYFFSSSGGHTEDIQNVWLGVSPASYLTGVSDPYDDSGDNPYYRWSDKLSLSTAAERLTGLYKGTFEGIKVLRHGVSPRIVSASVVGSKGATTVSGATLQEDLDTMSTWMAFTSVTAKASTSSGSGTAAAGSTLASASSTSGAASGGAAVGDVARAPLGVLSGSVFGAPRGSGVTVQRRSAGRWVTVGTARVGPSGAYALRVFGAGVYRAVYERVAAPSVTLR
jgi:stage II sporulation protein D